MSADRERAPWLAPVRGAPNLFYRVVVITRADGVRADALAGCRRPGGERHPGVRFLLSIALNDMSAPPVSRFLGLAGAPRRGRLVRFMALQKAFDHRISGPMMRWMKHIPVDRFGDPTPAYGHAIEPRCAPARSCALHPEAKVDPVVIKPGPAK